MPKANPLTLNYFSSESILHGLTEDPGITDLMRANDLIMHSLCQMSGEQWGCENYKEGETAFAPVFLPSVCMIVSLEEQFPGHVGGDRREITGSRATLQ